MAQPLPTSSKSRWGIPLVLPHGVLSLGLLAFAAFSEPPNRSETVRTMSDMASATSEAHLRRIGRN